MTLARLLENGACKLSVTDLLAALQFGEIDIDSSLVVSKDTLPDSGEQIMMLNNGCMCCTVRDDLVNMLNDLVCHVACFCDHVFCAVHEHILHKTNHRLLVCKQVMDTCLCTFYSCICSHL